MLLYCLYYIFPVIFIIIISVLSIDRSYEHNLSIPNGSPLFFSFADKNLFLSVLPACQYVVFPRPLAIHLLFNYLPQQPIASHKMTNSILFPLNNHINHFLPFSYHFQDSFIGYLFCPTNFLHSSTQLHPQSI